MSKESLPYQGESYHEVSPRELILKIQDWVSYLVSRWVTILLIVLLGSLLGLALSLIKKPSYTATSSFVLQEGEKAGGLSQYANIASMVGIDLGGGGGGIFQGDNLFELYKSRKMIKWTLLSPLGSNSDYLLIDEYIKFNDLRSKWNKKPNLKGIKFSNSEKLTRTQDSIINEIVKDINEKYLEVSKPDKRSSVIKVEVKSEDEVFSKSFNDAIVRNVNSFYVQTKTRKALENLSILQSKTDSVRKIMNSNVRRAANVADATPNMNPTRQEQRIAPIQQSQLSIETSKAMLGELIKSLELSKVQFQKEAPLIQMIDEPVYPLEVKRLGRVKGVILGGILGGILGASILIIRRFFKNILSE